MTEDTRGKPARPPGSEREDLPFPPAVGCLGSLLLGLLGVVLVFQVGKLLIQGELRFGGGPLTPNRLWLVREGTNQGLGWSSGQPVDELGDGQRTCVLTRVRFLLWRRDETARPVDYCQCYQRTAGGWEYVGDCKQWNQDGGP